MKIGLVDVDGGKFPNYALMKIAAYYKKGGDIVEWAQPLFQDYDVVYKSKVFKFTKEFRDVYRCPVIEGGTGYDIKKQLPPEMDAMQPDYSIYNITGTSYGFLTRGCCNHCPWCIVPIKEGAVRPYRDVDEIAAGNKNMVLMDNNILASEYGLQQLEKIMRRGYRVDFNQGLDARKITDEIAAILAKIRWIRYIRLACDKAAQIPYVIRSYKMLQKYGYKGDIFVYFLIDNWEDCIERLNALRPYRKKIKPFGQPYRDFNNAGQIIPKWQKDMARWMNQKAIYESVEFAECEIRKGFYGKVYYDENKRKN